MFRPGAISWLLTMPDRAAGADVDAGLRAARSASSSRIRASSGASSSRIRSYAGWPWSVFHTSRELLEQLVAALAQRLGGSRPRAHHLAVDDGLRIGGGSTRPPSASPADSSALPIGTPDETDRASSPNDGERLAGVAGQRRGLVAAGGRPADPQPRLGAEVCTPHPVVCRPPRRPPGPGPGSESTAGCISSGSRWRSVGAALLAFAHRVIIRPAPRRSTGAGSHRRGP